MKSELKRQKERYSPREMKWDHRRLSRGETEKPHQKDGSRNSEEAMQRGYDIQTQVQKWSRKSEHLGEREKQVNTILVWGEEGSERQGDSTG